MKIYKQLLVITSLLFLVPSISNAQNTEDEYNNFLRQRANEMQEFINKRDQEFSNFLKESWEIYTSVAGIEAPMPGPKEPPVYNKPEEPTKTQEKPTKPVKPTKEQTKPVRPIKEVKPPKPVRPAKDDRGKTGNVEFYGGEYKISTPTTSIYLSSIDEEAIAEAWTTMAKSNYKNLVDDCLSLKKELQLSDWGYILLTRKVGELLSKRKNDDEITFAQMFILLQSNYKIRTARTNNKLVLLVTSKQMIYSTPFVQLDGDRYFIITSDRATKTGAIYTYKKDFANAKNKLDMEIVKLPLLAENRVNKTFDHPYYPHEINTTVNKNLIDYYNAFPQFEFDLYINAGVDPTLEASILPQFAAIIKGKTSAEAATALLESIHRLFPYATDNEQFGYEKPYFLEECFFYPKSDCEDRSVLYAFLVRKLLKLDVILVEYPRHMATAVRFVADVPGDYVIHQGRKYIICDPTYINAPIGKAMSQYVNVKPKIFTFKQ